MPATEQKELSDLALKALEGRNGCLPANHGMLALGANLEKAMWRAMELETIARQYYLSLALGDPFILSDEQIAETAHGSANSGLRDGPRAKTAPKRSAHRAPEKGFSRRHKGLWRPGAVSDHITNVEFDGTCDRP